MNPNLNETSARILADLDRLCAAVERTREAVGTDALPTTEWTAERYEGRAGAPCIQLSAVNRTITQLRCTLQEGKALSPCESMALAHLRLFLA
jgi:hypothetical protein